MVKDMKKIIKIICISITSLLLAFMISVPVVNNYTAKKIVDDLQNIPLPDYTSYIESIYGAGKYTGNGNGMQYFGCILIRSDLGTEELQKYYSLYVSDEYKCIVEEQHEQKLKFIEHGNLSFDKEVGENCYIVYCWESGNEFYSQLDIRGH